MKEKHPCAGVLELAAYVEEKLPAGERKVLERHLAEHAECRGAVKVVRNVLASGCPSDEEVPENLIQKAIALHPANHGSFDLIISLMKDALTVVGAALDVRLSVPWSPAALRTRERAGISMIIMKKTFDTFTAELNIEKLRGNKCNITVIVTDRETRASMKNLRVNLISEDRELASNLLEKGRVLFEDIRRGRYDIVIQKKESPFGAMSIKIV